jgi:signal transduction histidine kinase
VLARIRDLLVPRTPLRLPRRTIRLRLTLLYASLFLVSGAGLLAITYVLVRGATGDVLVSTAPNGASVVVGSKGSGDKLTAPAVTSELRPHGSLNVQPPGGVRANRSGHLTAQQLRAEARRAKQAAVRQHDAELQQLIEQSAIALALMAAVSIALGWFFAGRVLRPLRTITERARKISASNLNARLALAGPDDELTQLADTFDELLARLEAAFAAQRQFVANASHELRTPLARARTLSEVALADPEASVESLRTSHKRVIAAGEQQERLIEALLTLARSERGLDQREAVDLAAVTHEVLAAQRADANDHHVRIAATLDPAQTSGDPRLVERLVTNLVSNAVRYNVLDGRVSVATGTRAGSALVAVSNTGPKIAVEDVPRLFVPFERLGRERTSAANGLGLGLSIVDAVAAAHGAHLVARPMPGGGLEVEVEFPARA